MLCLSILEMHLFLMEVEQILWDVARLAVDRIIALATRVLPMVAQV